VVHPGHGLPRVPLVLQGQGSATPSARTKAEEYLTNEKSLFAPCAPDDIRFATRRMKNYREYNDLVILSVAERMGLPLFSYDETFKRMATKNSVNLFEK
jgi:predicted nucleic acid-binding protein